MSRIFLCGLGLNGKSTILNRYPQLKSFSFSSNEEFGKIDDPVKQINMITEVRSKAYLNLPEDVVLVDRSIIDQLCMYSAIGLRSEAKGVAYYRVIDNLCNYFKSDDIIILINGYHNKDVEDLFYDLNAGRNSVYHNIDEYKRATWIFNAVFETILDATNVISCLNFYKINLKSFADLEEVYRIIDERTKETKNTPNR